MAVFLLAQRHRSRRGTTGQRIAADTDRTGRLAESGRRGDTARTPADPRHTQHALEVLPQGTAAGSTRVPRRCEVTGRF